MRQQEDRPKYWRKWLRDVGVTESLTSQFGELYRVLRMSQRRMWIFALAGSLAGATIGAAVAVLYVRTSFGLAISSLSLGLLLAAAALTAALLWWGVNWLMRQSRLRTAASMLTGVELLGEEPYVDRVLDSVVSGLARSELRPRDEQLELTELTQATMVTSLRGASTGELERNLLERLAGSSYVPAVDGSIFLFKVGRDCQRCNAVTRVGPLRLLNVPGHWAAENGYQRLRDLPSRGRHLQAAPGQAQALAEFVGHAGASVTRPAVAGRDAEVLLCEECAREAVRAGVAQDRTR